MSDLDELLVSFRAVGPDEPDLARIRQGVEQHARATRHRRRRRRMVLLAAAAAVVAVVVALEGLGSGRPQPAEAFARELHSLAGSGDVLHVVTSTTTFEASGAVDPAHVRVPAGTAVARAEQWSASDRLLVIDHVGGTETVYTASRSEHRSYVSNLHLLTIARWASAAERDEALRQHAEFGPSGLLTAYRKGRVRLVGATTWRGRRALRFVYRAAPDTFTYFVDPSSYHPLALVDTYDAGRGGTFVIERVYDTFERLAATPRNLARLSFAAPAGTKVHRERLVPYRPVAVGNGMRPKARAWFAKVPIFDTVSGRFVADRDRPEISQARAIAVAPLESGAGQWILYRAPRSDGGTPCYAFVDNRKDGRDVRAGSWMCTAASRLSATLSPSPDMRSWELGGRIGAARAGEPAIARLRLVVGGNAYPVRLLPGGLFIATAPAIGDASLRAYTASGTLLHGVIRARLTDYEQRQVG